jgi:hypothetical protein
LAPPNKETVTAAIDELRKNGARWRAAAEELHAAKNQANRLSLGQFEFSAPADWVGVTDVYRELHDKLTRLLDEGASTLDAMAMALFTAADGYDEDERNAVHRMRSVW